MIVETVVTLKPVIFSGNILKLFSQQLNLKPNTQIKGLVTNSVYRQEIFRTGFKLVVRIY